MTSKYNIIQNLTEELINQHLSEVTENSSTWIFLQGPYFIGFGVVRKTHIEWPPSLQKMDWSLATDIRLFGEKGEWHFWQTCNRSWKSRLYQVNTPTDAIKEFHYLWGTQSTKNEGCWTCFTEERGASIWLPIDSTKVVIPLRMQIFQIVGQDFNGIAGIVDAALIALYDGKSNTKLYPPEDEN